MKPSPPKATFIASSSDFGTRPAVVPDRRRRGVVVWDFAGPPRRKSLRLVPIGRFSARGLRPVYGRGDHFQVVICMLDMWQRKDGRILVRFSSPRNGCESCSFEVEGYQLPPLLKGSPLLGEDCVPEIVRDRYEEWVQECLE